MVQRGDPRLEQAYARAEDTLDGYYATRRRRGPPILLGTLLALTLAVGLVVAVDLRRLQTPSGTALAWTGATVFGDCTAFLKLSTPAAASESRTDDELCTALRQRTAVNRDTAAQIAIDLQDIRQAGAEATAVVSVRRPGRSDDVTLTMRRRGGGWVVVRTPGVCLALGCP